MKGDLIRYDIHTQEALRGVIRKVLREVSKTGLPGEHHFFITFQISAPGVVISPRLKAQYADMMTIVIQHQFWDFAVSETGFEIGLTFSGVPEKLTVPFASIKSFADPAASFELEFDLAGKVIGNEPAVSVVVKEAPPPIAGTESAKALLKPDTGRKPTEKQTGAVVSLDAFRKKT